MPKQKVSFECSECGYETPRWMGKCVRCGSFNSFKEKITEQNARYAPKQTAVFSKDSVYPLKDIESINDSRFSTGMGELDRVLSGGIVNGSLILLGGDPGVGKSTLLMQICQKIGELNKKILYISGEESVKQIKLRADRLNISTGNLFIMSETNLETIISSAKNTNPDLLIIDSIQTVYSGDISSAPGSVSQVRESTAHFMHLSKQIGIATVLVGHVTKDGAIAGPKILEHMVDTVLYFEGEKQASYRLIRAVKNRFGQTNEIGVFEMCESGLREILNPSEYLLAGRPLNVPGSVITCAIEGTRPILAEVQALVTGSNFNMPRRNVSGADFNRAAMLIAVLEKRAGAMLGGCDCYINLTGGLKINEPALDAAVVTAVASSFRNVPVAPDMIVFGEVGLVGEIRAVNMAEARIIEAFKLGFRQCALPRANFKGLKKPKDMRVFGISNINELLDITCGA